MLASGLPDLRYGMVLCDLACFITGKPPIQGVRRGYVALDGNRVDGVHNLGLFLREFRMMLPETLRVDAEALYDSEKMLYDVVKFWAGSKDPGFVAGLSPIQKTKNADLPKGMVRQKPRVVTPPPSIPSNPSSARQNTSEDAHITPRPRTADPATPSKSPDKPVPLRPSRTQHRPQLSVPDPDLPLQPPKQTTLDIPPVSESTKERLFSWLQSLDLVRKSVRIEEFPSLCTNGVLICDLINRLEGRSEAIKGIERNPKNRTNVQSNFAKGLGYLRGFDKMNSRYLWATGDLMNGVEDVVWGVIEDIKMLFKATKVTMERSRSTSRERSVSYQPTTAVLASPKASRLPPRVPKSELTPRPANSALVKGITAEYTPIQVTNEVQKILQDWLISLKLGHFLGFENKNYLSDPLRNGVLLCELVSILEKCRIPNIDKSPESVQSVRENIEKALCLLRDRNPSLPLSLLRQGERLSQGSTKLLWNLLWTLRTAYPSAKQEIVEAPEPKSELPYKGVNLKRLEMSVVSWIYSLGVSGRGTCPQDLTDIMGEIRSGGLLCDLVAKVLPCTIPGVTRSPKSDSVALANIKKALEPLRKNSRMSQMFVWKEKEIAAGDVGAILGLLEDLHRYSDGLTARKRGSDYHRDGPYLGRQYVSKSYSSLSSRAEVAKAMELARKQASIPPPSPVTHSIPLESPLNRFRLNRQDQFAPLQPPSRSKSPNFRLQTDPEASSDLTEDRFRQWMDSIGVVIPSHLHFNDPETFRNGVILCQILESLRNERIKGFVSRPKTTAAALNNVKKCLEVMRTVASFPGKLLFVEEEVVRGNLEVIHRLLKEIYRCFQSTIQTAMRVKERVIRRTNSDYSFRHNRSIS